MSAARKSHPQCYVPGNCMISTELERKINTKFTIDNYNNVNRPSKACFK